MYTYEQKTGRLLHNGTLIATGYAGGNIPPHHEPGAVNNPDRQFDHMVGPLPQEEYTIGPAMENTRLGPCALPLWPKSQRNMHGRGGFFMHADSAQHPGQASEGCPVIRELAIRQAINAGKDRDLTVVHG